MSSRELEDRADREQAEWVASALGISVDELDQKGWTIDLLTGHDGAAHGCRVTFDDGTSQRISLPPEHDETEEF